MGEKIAVAYHVAALDYRSNLDHTYAVVAAVAAVDETVVCTVVHSHDPDNHNASVASGTVACMAVAYMLVAAPICFYFSR